MSTWLWQTIASSAAAGVIAFLSLLFLTPAKFWEKSIGLWFDKKLEAFKSEQNEKLARLQEQLSHLTDRGRLSNEREYAATAKAWEAYVDAHYATRQSVVAFISSPDLDSLTQDRLDEFLTLNQFSLGEINDLKKASDKNHHFARVMQFRLINKAWEAWRTARDVINKQGVFIERNLQDLFDQNLERLNRAWGEERINLQMNRQELHEHRDSLILNGELWLDDLRTRVRERLLRNLPF